MGKFIVKWLSHSNFTYNAWQEEEGEATRASGHTRCNVHDVRSISKPALLYSAQRFDLTTWYRTILKQEEGAEQRKKFPVTLGKYILYTNISLECWALPTVEQKSKMASWRGIIAAQQWGAWQQGQSSSSRALWTVQAGQQCRYSINWWSREWQMAALASAQGYQV